MQQPPDRQAKPRSGHRVKDSRRSLSVVRRKHTQETKKIRKKNLMDADIFCRTVRSNQKQSIVAIQTSVANLENAVAVAVAAGFCLFQRHGPHNF